MKYQSKKRVNKKSLSIARAIHIYVSMALFLFMLFYAFIGITLNHPDRFEYYSRYKMKGSDKPVRTRVDKLATKAMMPKGAYDLEGALYFSGVETYVTLNTPNNAAFKPTNQYFELVPITHPADIVEKNDTEFKFRFNDKPVKNAEVSIVREGTLYRNQIEAIEVKSDYKGIISFIPQEAGRYLLHATYEKELKDNALADKMFNKLFLTFEAGLE